MRRFLLSLLCCCGIAACSLYQSEGRKFLEKNAISFAASGTAFGKLRSRQCADYNSRPEELDNAEIWTWAEQREEANIFTSEDPNRVAMTVEILSGDFSGSRICLITYRTLSEMLAHQEADIAAAIAATP